MESSGLIKIANELVLNKIGLEISTVGNFILESAISKRMKYTALDQKNYAEKLAVSESEQLALTQLLLISESWFERESEPILSALKELEKTKKSIKILSLPCARGEEPITILYYALNYKFPISNISIEGYDASLLAIEQAKLFSYGEYSFRGTSQSFKNNLFDPHGPRLQLKKYFQGVFEFDQTNILDDDWKPKFKKYDLIACRNLLIYLKPECQVLVLKKLSALLDDGGLLILGAAEAGLANGHPLKCINSSPLVFKNEVIKNQTNHQSLNNLDRPRVRKNTVSLKVQEIRKDINKVDSVNESKNRITTLDSYEIKNLTEKIFKLADSGQVDLAFEMALETLEIYPEDANILFVLGLINSSFGQIDEARQWLIKALNSQPSFEEAQMLLQTLCEGGLNK